ncbi:MAG: hypothetical protein ACFFBD_18015, partial [Candidatus Hodarchaeota archaeon]
MIKKTPEVNLKRKKIFEMITKLACKMPENPIEVPEGLEGFGTIEINNFTCISCHKCKDLACEWDAIIQNTDLPLKDYLSYEKIDDLPINRRILLERLKTVFDEVDLSVSINVPVSIFNLGGMKISRRNCVSCQKCVEICPTESMVFKPYFHLAEVLDPTKIKPYPYKPTKEDLKKFEPEILTFFCHWCTYG